MLIFYVVFLQYINLLNWYVWLNMKNQIVLKNMSENVNSTRTHTNIICNAAFMYDIFIFNVYKVLSFSTSFMNGGSVSHIAISKCGDRAVLWPTGIVECINGVCGIEWVSELANERMNELASVCMFTSSQCFSIEMRRLFGASWTTSSML